MPSLTTATTWSGYYLDGKTAARHQVTVHTSAHALLIMCEDGRNMAWPYGELLQTLKAYEDGPVRLEYGLEVLVIADRAFLTALQDTAPADAKRQLHNPLHCEARERLTVLVAVTAFIIGGILYSWGIQSFAWAIAPWVPPGWKTQWDKTMIDDFAPRTEPCVDEARTDTLNRVVDALMAHAPHLRRPIRVIVVRNPESIAQVRFSDTIEVSSGLLERTDNPEQFAGIIAHELQHALRHHTTRMHIEQNPIHFLLFAISNAFSLSEENASQLERFFTRNPLQYKRYFEDEADVEMIRMLQAAGIDPHDLILYFLTEFPDSYGIRDTFSTHAPIKDRIKKLLSLSNASATKPGGFLSDIDWDHVRSICDRAQPSTGKDY